MEGGGAGPFENEVQDYLLAGGDLNTKIPFNKNIKGSAGGAIFKETYTFDFNKDVPTMKTGGKFIWNIKGGKWEPFGTKDGNENQEEPMDVESMKKEIDADPGTFATDATMMTIADAAKIWPETIPGSEYGYDKRLKDIVKFMEGKKITKMTPENVKEFEGEGKKEPAAAQPQQESKLGEGFLGMSLNQWWDMLHPLAIIASIAGGSFMAMKNSAKKAIIKQLQDAGEKIPDEKTLNDLATKAVGQKMDQTTGAGRGSMEEGNIESIVNEALKKHRRSK
jgi:hypothetical protein